MAPGAHRHLARRRRPDGAGVGDMASLELRGVEKEFDRGPKVIRGVDLRVEDGEFMVLVGPSGCGKSTLLRLIAGLEEISEGDLLIDGVRANDVAPSRRGVAMVFQNYALYPHLTVAENMGLSLRIGSRMPRREVEAAVGRVAEVLHLSHLLGRHPRQLSGGQRQRVAIGRAIVRKPRAFLFDEPLSNLDAALRLEMRFELARLHRELGTTMVHVTHDQVEAMTLGDRIAVVNGGRIEQVGKPVELYDRPANQFVAGFLGSPTMNFVPCRVLGGDSEHATLAVDGAGTLAVPVPAASLAVGAEVTLGVRPEHLAVASEGDGVAASVDVVEHLGDSQILHLLLPDGQTVVAKRPAERASPSPGDRVRLRPRPEACHLFAPDGRSLGNGRSRGPLGRKSTRLNSSHQSTSRMPSSA